jgi:hypothetical protein
MARGWESKSVEEQMAASQQSSVFPVSAQETRRIQVEKAHVERQRQALELQKENILSQRTSNPGRRAALEAALVHVEAQLEALN